MNETFHLERAHRAIKRLESVNTELLKALEHSVESLAVARDAITDLISNKPEKWVTYVELTDAMRIPQINMLIAKAKSV